MMQYIIVINYHERKIDLQVHDVRVGSLRILYCQSRVKKIF